VEDGDPTTASLLRLMASIGKRPGPDGKPRYDVRWREGNIGAERQRSRSFRTKADAERFLVNLAKALQDGTWKPAATRATSVADFIAGDHWRSHVATLAPSTRRIYATNIELRVLPYLGIVPLGRIGRGDVKAWLTKLGADGHGAGVIAQTLRTFRTVLAVAVDAEIIEANPASRVAAPKATVPPAERTERRALSAAETADLIEATPARYRALVAVAAYTGLRISEVAGLRRADVDMLRLDVHVRQQLARYHGRHFSDEDRRLGAHLRQPKTSAAVRTVPLPPALRPMLDEHMSTYVGADANALVFTSPSGKPLAVNNWGRRVFTPSLRTAGLEHLVPHALRATFTTNLVASGVDVRTAQQLLGHGSPTVTLSAYARVRPEAIEDARAKLDVLASVAPTPKNRPRAL